MRPDTCSADMAFVAETIEAQSLSTSFAADNDVQ